MFQEKGKLQQDYETDKIRKLHEGPAIVQAAMQYFRQIGTQDAAYVLKKYNLIIKKFGRKWESILIPSLYVKHTFWIEEWLVKSGMKHEE